MLSEIPGSPDASKTNVRDELKNRASNPSKLLSLLTPEEQAHLIGLFGARMAVRDVALFQQLKQTLHPIEILVEMLADGGDEKQKCEVFRLQKLPVKSHHVDRCVQLNMLVLAKLVVAELELPVCGVEWPQEVLHQVTGDVSALIERCLEMGWEDSVRLLAADKLQAFHNDSARTADKLQAFQTVGWACMAFKHKKQALIAAFMQKPRVTGPLLFWALGSSEFSELAAKLRPLAKLEGYKLAGYAPLYEFVKMQDKEEEAEWGEFWHMVLDCRSSWGEALRIATPAVCSKMIDLDASIARDVLLKFPAFAQRVKQDAIGMNMTRFLLANDVAVTTRAIIEADDLKLYQELTNFNEEALKLMIRKSPRILFWAVREQEGWFTEELMLEACSCDKDEVVEFLLPHTRRRKELAAFCLHWGCFKALAALSK